MVCRLETKKKEKKKKTSKVIYVKNPTKSIKTFLEYNNITEHNFSIQKMTYFLCTSNEQWEIKILKIPLIVPNTHTNTYKVNKI